MDKIVIYADHRENGTRIPDLLKNKSDSKISVDVIQKQLGVADFLLSERVAVERKTVEDFLQSIVDGRLFKQASNLKRSYKKPLLIIEGEDDIFSSRNIHPNAICGAMASISIDSCIPIIWTKNQKETANFLYTIAKREQTELEKSVRIREKIRLLTKNQRQEYIVSGLPKISTVLARRLLEYFKTPENIFKASEEELVKVDGIGKDRAKIIRKSLTRKYQKNILD
ncbi:MAG: hypothetical protein HY831_00765 [Candidatus Aenigmarchaeota archaeon]|nr:hypothetical protein [Candidatus Aenigmarchaeota archaeon]